MQEDQNGVIFQRREKITYYLKEIKAQQKIRIERVSTKAETWFDRFFNEYTSIVM